MVAFDVDARSRHSSVGGLSTAQLLSPTDVYILYIYIYV